ncbi:MAG: polyprenyl synthetase family protein [Myxococcales bacterium]|nr:polyprenyl synthetase family protein [Myxococcales bacterium]
MRETIEGALDTTLRLAEAGAPPRLASALRYAVFPGGARTRPGLCLAVASACGADGCAAALGLATALELVHSASLVHDDMPCFDDAATRRGRPAVHVAFDEPTALLVGDGLIVLAFESLARSCVLSPSLLGPLVITLARATGSPHGLVAGQSWESVPSVPLERYHRAKTGALFVAATTGGALAAGHDGERWRALGERLGEAYQVADDMLDALATDEGAGKPVGQDASLGRPNAVAQLGVDGAVARLRSLVEEAVAAVPPCPGATKLEGLVRSMACRLVPEAWKQSAA